MVSGVENMFGVRLGGALSGVVQPWCSRTARLLVVLLGGCAAPSGSPAKAVDADATPTPGRACSAQAELKPEPSFGNVINPRVVAADFKVVPPREVEPCVWRGTFAAATVLYADREAKVPLLTTQFVRVKAFELPRLAGQPTKLIISWPIHVEAWAPAASFPLALREPVEIVKGAYGLAAGARVQAWASERPGTAVVSRPYSRNFSHSAFAKGGLLEQMPCSKLTLPFEGLFERTATANSALKASSAESWLDLAPGTELHSEPGGPATGRVVGRSVALVEQRGDWVNVHSYDSLGPASAGGVDFWGWVRKSSTTPGPASALAFGPIWLEPTHKARTQLALRREPDAAAPLLGKTAKGVPFRALRSERGFVEIHLPGLAHAGLWIAEGDLCDSELLR